MKEQKFENTDDVEACIKRIHSGKGRKGDMEIILALVNPLVIRNAMNYFGPIPDDLDGRVADLKEMVWEATLAFSPEKVEGHIVPAFILYIRRTLKNYLIKMAKKRPSVGLSQLDDVIENCVPDTRPYPEEVIMDEVEESLYKAAIAKLSTIDRELLLRHYRDHVSNDCLADLYKDQHVGCGEAVRKRNRRNREKVLKMMECE